jgi:ATP-binding cassette subfamily B protein
VVALGLACLVLSNAAGIATPWLLGRAIDTLGQAGNAARDIPGHAALIVGAAAFSGFARFWMRLLLNSYSRRVEFDLRNAFFDRLLHLDAAFYGGTRTGDLMTRATNDTQAVRMAVGPGVMYFANTVVMTALALAVMIRTDLRLTLVALIPLVFLAPVMLYFGREIHVRFERIQDHFGTLATMVQENLSGVRIVRAYTQESEQEREFDALSAEYFAKNMALARVSALFHPILGLLSGLGMLVVLWMGSLAIIDGRLSPGDFVAFLFYLGLLTWPMMAIGWVINLFQRGSASLKRIARILDTEPTVQPPAVSAAVAPLAGEVEFNNVSFRYPGTTRDVLHEVSFRIGAGRTAALVGPTGAGKSTVLALLARRYDPTAGGIFIDGVPLPDIPFDTLRTAVGVVPQDAFVFSDTIGNNIGLGLPPGVAADGRIERAAAVARLAETVAAFPAGFDTRLGERGVNLSGGQRQRATLARALARDPRILLLDDALSAVDTHTEAEILRSLREELRRRTALIVSHRVTAVMHADLILVLEDGCIVEQGAHADLTHTGGVYATLLRRQLIEDDLEEAGAGIRDVQP